MKATQTYGQSYCGYDNIVVNHPDHCNKKYDCGPVPDYFPNTPLGDTTFYICNNEPTDKIFKRLECNQKPIPEYRPSFEVCRKTVDMNDLPPHPKIVQVDHCADLKNEFTPCKGDGLGYLRRVVLENELRCVNERLTKSGKLFTPNKLPNKEPHDFNLNVSEHKLGPHGVCDPFGVNPCVNYGYKEEKCGPYGLMLVGEKERMRSDFLPIGPRRCDQKNRCEMIWDNISKRHYKVAIPAYTKPDNNYKPIENEGYPVKCPPVCKYDYDCI
jgi:hypothetical protein